MYLKTITYPHFDNLQLKESKFKTFHLPNHFHDTYCIGFQSEGFKTTEIEGKSFIVHANTVGIINPYQIHNDVNFDQDASVYRMIYINKDIVNYFAQKTIGTKTPEIVFSNELISSKETTNAVMRFFANTEKIDTLESKMHLLIQLLLNKYTINQCGKSKELGGNAIHDSIQWARTNFTEKINITHLAEKSHLSKFQFIRQFKKHTGLTPAAYMIVCRINFAKKMLLQNTPMVAVALDAGFYDQAQFNHYFKYFTGLTPLQYMHNSNIIQD